jgi:hypothetical protein
MVMGKGHLLGKLTYYTDDEHQRIKAFKGAPPAVREYMLQTLESILEYVDDEGIRVSCGRLLSAMGRER